MMRRNTAADGVVIPAPADPDTISDSGSSTTALPPQLGRKQTNSVLQVVRAGASVTSTGPEDGQPVAAVDEVMSQVVQGTARAVAAAGNAINSYLRTHGRIPMIRSQGPNLNLDLNALAPPDASQPPPRVDQPVICAYCNCAFCFAAHELPSLNPVPGYVYPAPPEPITFNLLAPPAVAPLYRDRDPRGPGATPSARLLVCSCENHFKVTMGMLQQQAGRAPLLDWKCTVSCLGVLPIVVGSEGSNSPDLHGNPAPPPEPWTYAGAYWNYVKPGDEDLVKLKLHDDPLKLTLGRR